MWGPDKPFRTIPTAYDPLMEVLSHGELLRRAAAGDSSAWNDLVERFSQMVWSIARGFRLDDATAKDVSQTVWLKLVENIDRIADPERLPGWLATTARREALRVSKARDRDITTDFEYDVADETSPTLDEMLIDDEENRTVVSAFATLDAACQQLLRLMMIEPALTYEEISESTGRPIGSLGPTRSRCLDKLKSAISRISSAGGGS